MRFLLVFGVFWFAVLVYEFWTRRLIGQEPETTTVEGKTKKPFWTTYVLHVVGFLIIALLVFMFHLKGY